MRFLRPVVNHPQREKIGRKDISVTIYLRPTSVTTLKNVQKPDCVEKRRKLNKKKIS
jgi:hypothetical protein